MYSSLSFSIDFAGICCCVPELLAYKAANPMTRAFEACNKKKETNEFGSHNKFA
jgi:hypothetical protein